MVNNSQIRLAIMRVVQRKREHNRARMNDQRQPNQPEFATFIEIQKELEKNPEIKAVPELLLQSALVELVRNRAVLTMRNAFLLPTANRATTEAIERYWGTK